MLLTPCKKSIAPVLLTAVLGVAGCASGPTLSELEVAPAAPAPGQSRIAVYRSGIAGAAIQPAINVNDVATGACQPNSVFFVDLEPGQHTVTAATEVTRSVDVDTAVRPVSYVQCSIGFGLLVGRPNLAEVEVGVGTAAINDLVFTGTYTIGSDGQLVESDVE